MTCKMLVDIDRCIGCWTCAMACKVGNHLDDDEYRIEVETRGCGKGIDRPAGTYPNLHMWWQPSYSADCTFCGSRIADGLPAFCVMDCPTKALAFGDDANPESEYSQALARVKERNANVFELDAEQGTRANIVYSSTRK